MNGSKIINFRSDSWICSHRPTRRISGLVSFGSGVPARGSWSTPNTPSPQTRPAFITCRGLTPRVPPDGTLFTEGHHSRRRDFECGFRFWNFMWQTHLIRIYPKTNTVGAIWIYGTARWGYLPVAAIYFGKFSSIYSITLV